MKSYYINIKDISYDKNADFLLKYVNENKRNKALRYKFKEDRIRTLIGDVLVRALICRKFQYKNEDITYGYNDFKKPYLINNPKLCFNISHSGDYVAAAFDDEEVGIDIEEIKEMDYEGIVKRYFTKEEYRSLMKLDEKERIKGFYKLWTLKESYVKFKGKGINIPFDSFGFDTDYKNNIFKLNNSSQKLFFKNYNIKNAYELSLCSLKEDVTVEEITYEELEDLIKRYL